MLQHSLRLSASSFSRLVQARKSHVTAFSTYSQGRPTTTTKKDAYLRKKAWSGHKLPAYKMSKKKKSRIKRANERLRKQGGGYVPEKISEDGFSRIVSRTTPIGAHLIDIMAELDESPELGSDVLDKLMPNPSQPERNQRRRMRQQIRERAKPLKLVSKMIQQKEENTPENHSQLIHVLDVHGDVEKARQVFEKLELEEANRIQTLKENPTTAVPTTSFITEKAVSSLMSAIAHSSSPGDVLTFIDRCDRKGYPLNVVSLTSCAQALFRAGKFDNAVKLVQDRVIDAGIKVDKILLVTMLDGYMNNGMFREGIEFYRSCMLVKGPQVLLASELDITACSTLIQLHGKAKQVERALQIHDLAVTKLDPVFTSKDDARNLFHQTMLACTKLYRVAENAYDIFDEMKAYAEPDEDSFEIALAVTRVLGDIDKAEELWAEMSKVGIEPDLGHYNAMLETLARANWQTNRRKKKAPRGPLVDPAEASVRFYEARDDVQDTISKLMKLPADAHLTSAGNLVYDKRDRFRAKTLVTRETVEREFDDILARVVGLGDVDRKVLEEPVERYIDDEEDEHETSEVGEDSSSDDVVQLIPIFEPLGLHKFPTYDLSFYTEAKPGLIQKQCIARSEQLWEELKSNGYEPDVDTLNAYMNVFAQAFRIQRALDVWRMFDQLGVERSERSYSIIISMLARAQRVDAAHEMLEQYRADPGFPPVSRTLYGVVADAYARKGQYSASLAVFLQIVAAGHSPVERHLRFIRTKFKEKPSMWNTFKDQREQRRIGFGLDENLEFSDQDGVPSLVPTATDYLEHSMDSLNFLRNVLENDKDRKMTGAELRKAKRNWKVARKRFQLTPKQLKPLVLDPEHPNFRKSRHFRMEKRHPNHDAMFLQDGQRYLRREKLENQNQPHLPHLQKRLQAMKWREAQREPNANLELEQQHFKQNTMLLQDGKRYLRKEKRKNQSKPSHLAKPLQPMTRRQSRNELQGHNQGFGLSMKPLD